MMIWFQIVVVASLQAVVHGIDALWTETGTNTILVIADIHTDVISETCENPDWTTFELVQGLQWKNNNENSTIGMEIFDTCGSVTRAREVLQERLGAANSTSPTVSGIISYTKPAISVLISNAAQVFDVLHIDLGDRDPSIQKLSSSSLTVHANQEFKQNTLKEVLKQADWSYVTVLDDGDATSIEEHETFLNSVDNNDLCVQYSGSPTRDSMFKINDIKTPGVVVFASNKTFIEDVMKNSDPSTAIILVTNHKLHFRKFGRNIIVISNQYESTDELANFIANDLWKLNNTSELTRLYYTEQQNCTLNTATDALVCPNGTSIFEHVKEISGSASMHRLYTAYVFVTQVTKQMTETNCSSMTWSRCMTNIDVVTQKIEEGNVLLANSNMVIDLVQNSSVAQVTIQSGTVLAMISAKIQSMLSQPSIQFSASECQRWCPSCQSKKCDQTKQLKYDKKYYSISGDIQLLGMFPLSSQWDENGEGHCSGITSENNTDILVEAFTFAIQSVKSRYPHILPNVNIGALVVDTCSSSRRTMQLGMNFESCLYEFQRDGANEASSPYITPARLVSTTVEQKGTLSSALEGSKLTLVLDRHGNIDSGGNVLYDVSVYNYHSVVNLLHDMGWTHVGVLRSQGSLRQLDIDGLYSMTKSNNICISYNLEIPTENNALYSILPTIRDSGANTVVMFATSSDINRFFRTLTQRTVIKSWILVETRENLLELSAYPLPLGTLVIKRKGVQNNNFNSHIENVLNSKSSKNPWINMFTKARAGCTNCAHSDVLSDVTTLSRASDVIKAVDGIMGTLNDAYSLLCPERNGLCPEFWNNGSATVSDKINEVKFVYQEETIDLSQPVDHGNFGIYNLQTAGIILVGNWTNNMLSLESEKVTSYDSLGNVLEKPRDSYCFSKCSVCVNYKNVSGNESDIIEFSDLDEEMGYKDSSAEFDRELWSIIVVIIAGSGTLLTMFLMLYIMCKVCLGALLRRYLVLGILLLVAMVFIFLSVLPFVFTPSEPVCGMRFFAHGFSYAFGFAIILTKMTTLRDYRYIGLGGEISRINQMLSVFFITGVQIAIGIQWWISEKPNVYSISAFERESGKLVEKDFYACNFDRKDFIAYHSYVLFLIVLCCFYSIGVRKETKNMKEARLLLICSWFILAIWIALIVTLLTLSRELLEAVCSIGLLATALTMMVVIYLPKLTAISRLKYEVEAAGRKENGYKVDPDFQFERPYSLPGTMHSSITDKTLSFPRSLAAFDTSLSY